jgi:hypothetical protein
MVHVVLANTTLPSPAGRPFPKGVSIFSGGEGGVCGEWPPFRRRTGRRFAAFARPSRREGSPASLAPSRRPPLDDVTGPGGLARRDTPGL